MRLLISALCALALVSVAPAASAIPPPGDTIYCLDEPSPECVPDFSVGVGGFTVSIKDGEPCAGTNC